MDNHEFTFGSFNDGEIAFARTTVNGITVEFQGWNTFSVHYDKVLVIKDGTTIFVDNSISLDSVAHADVQHYIEKALK